jgi:Zn-dependent protease
MFIAVQLNLLLVAFNLIPIPPLDGSHVIKYLMPASWAYNFQRFGRYGIIVLIILLYAGGGFLSVWMRPALAFQGFLFRYARPYALPSLGEWLS